MTSASFIRRWVPSVIALVPFITGAVLYFAAASQARHAETVSAASELSASRTGRVQREFAERRLSLDTLVAFFAASETVSPEAFETFAASLLRQGDVMAVCWSSADQARTLVASAPGQEQYCDALDPLEPSRVLGGARPVVLLSELARRGDHAGYATLAFHVEPMFVREQEPRLREYLVINNVMQNTSVTYSVGSDALVQGSLAQLGSDPPHRAHELERIGGVEFVYLTQVQPTLTSLWRRSEALVSFMLLCLGVAAAALVRVLVHQRERVRAEVQHRTAELTDFAYRTSHDLRGPLVSIHRLAGCMAEDLRDGWHDDLDANVGRISKQARRLIGLTDDIFALTQADMGDEPTELVDLEAMISEIHEHVAASYPERAIALRSQVETQPMHLARARVARIIENLVANGVKYAAEREESWVTTRLRTVRRTLCIEIEDNGLGIPAECVARLFDRFSRFHPDVADGTGLGLAIVERHVQHLGGTIEVHSTEGEGTRFCVNLPLGRAS